MNPKLRHTLIFAAMVLASWLQMAQMHDWAIGLSLAANGIWLFE